jgi:beta-glucanase (GH16 family)
VGVARDGAREWLAKKVVHAQRGDHVVFRGALRVKSDRNRRPVRLAVVERSDADSRRTVRTVKARDGRWERFVVRHLARSKDSRIMVRARVARGGGSRIALTDARVVVTPAGSDSSSEGGRTGSGTGATPAPYTGTWEGAPTPGAEAPTIDAPADEAPAVDSPADEAPAVDSPADEAPAVDSPAGEAPAGWRLHWSDEFSGTALNTSNWQAYHNTYGDGNNELACLTPQNITLAAGVATFTARRQTVSCPGGTTERYTSGFMGSREAGRYLPLYGRFEIRAQVPHGQGLWPAFWLRHRLGAGVAEVDIMEYFFSQVPGKATQTLHFPTTVGRNVAKRSVAFEAPVKGTGGWHTYAVEIEPVTGTDGSTDVRFRFLIDDVETLKYLNTVPEAWNQVDPNAAWDIAVNLAVGGDWAGHPDEQLGYLQGPDVCSLTYRAPTGGNPANCPTSGIWLPDLPSPYRVDHVRVYTR